MEPSVLELPLVGSVDLGQEPLLLATILIAFVDGFNPCSLWVLTLLLGLVIHSGSRRKVLLVGITFLTVTAAVYGLFIVGLLNIFAFIDYLDGIRVGVALLALAFAAVNIKDYFFFGRGISLTISEQHKPGIYQGMRRVMASGGRWPATMAATTVLAAGVALVELPCTAGFPVIWSGLVAARPLAALGFAALILLYLAVYLLVELVIFISAVVTLKSGRFQEQHGRLLKLAGGMIMLALALVMLFWPDVMHDLSGSLAVFAGALAAALLVVVLDRGLRPGAHRGRAS